VYVPVCSDDDSSPVEVEKPLEVALGVLLLTSLALDNELPEVPDSDE
jgi:hypothetical protein